jgi:rhodanese-related sulfurtransferase
MFLCFHSDTRTGVRSVGAANRLTEAGYTNVSNMWEGWVGVNLKAPQVVRYDEEGNEIIADASVDLNHDGVLT